MTSKSWDTMEGSEVGPAEVCDRCGGGTENVRVQGSPLFCLDCKALVGGPTFDALAEFVAMVSMRGNAFAVGAKADGSGTIILNPGPFIGGRALSQAEVTNLVAWLVVVSGIAVDDVCQYVVAVLKGQQDT